MSAKSTPNRLMDAEAIFGEIVSELNEPAPEDGSVATAEPEPIDVAGPARTEDEQAEVEAVPLAAVSPTESPEGQATPRPEAQVEPPQESETSDSSDSAPEDAGPRQVAAMMSEVEKGSQPDSEPAEHLEPPPAPAVDTLAAGRPASDREIACWIDTTLSLVRRTAVQATDTVPPPDQTRSWLEHTLEDAGLTEPTPGAQPLPISAVERQETGQTQEGEPAEAPLPEEATESETTEEMDGLYSAEEIRQAQGEVRLIERLRARKLLVAAVIVGLLAGLLATLLATRLLYGTWLPRAPQAVVHGEPRAGRPAGERIANPVPPPLVETSRYPAAQPSNPTNAQLIQTDEVPADAPQEQ